MKFSSILKLLKRWKSEDRGIAGVEAAMIFPVMLLLMVGVYDLGNAILVNQKTVRASQVVADLITRNNVVSNADITEAIDAGRLAFEPLDRSSYGVDIVSIRFDEDADSEIVWRETYNMSPDADPLSKVTALEDADSGVVMVSVVYDFEPLFAGYVIDAFGMKEVAFARGRSTPVITKSP